MAKKLHLVHVKSAVADKAPSASTLDYGEIAVNYNSETPALYIKDDEDNIVKFISEPYFTKIVGTGITENDDETITPLTEVIEQDEITISAALNDLNDRKADKEYVDGAISGVTVDIDDLSDEVNSLSSSLTNNYYTKDEVDDAIEEVTIDVDDYLDSASTNPVENRVIYEAMEDKADAMKILYLADETGVTTSEQKAHNLEVLEELITNNAFVDLNKSRYIKIKLVGLYGTDIDFECQLYSCAKSANDEYVIIFNLPFTLFRFYNGIYGIKTTDGEIILSEVGYPMKVISTRYYISEGLLRLSDSANTEFVQTGITPGEGRALGLPKFSEIIDAAAADFIVENGGPSYGFGLMSGYYEFYYDTADKKVRVRVYDDDSVTTLWTSSDFSIDDHLDSASTNPVENRAIYEWIVEDELAVAAAMNDLNDRKAEKSDLDEIAEDLDNKADISYVDDAIASIEIDVDDQMDSASTNPVENRVIYDVIVRNERVVASALNEINNRKAEKSELSGITEDLEDKADISYVDAAIASIDVESDIFWATCGTTTYDEVESAYTAGKIVMVKVPYQNTEYVLTLTTNDTNDSGVYYFKGVGAKNLNHAPIVVSCYIFDDDSWSTVTGNEYEFLPSFSASDAGKVLRVSSTGTLEWVSPSTIYTGSGTPQQSLGNDGDIYLQTS